MSIHSVLLRTSCSILFCLVFVPLSFAQQNLNTVGHSTYAQYDSVWYTVVDNNRGDRVDIKHLVVRLKDKSDVSAFDFSAVGLSALRDVRGRIADGYYELEIPEGRDPFEVGRVLQATNKFDEVSLNFFYRIDGVPGDPQYNNQWNLQKIAMANAWNISVGSSSIIVAVIDWGVDYSHEDLAANCWSGIGYDFVDNDSDPYPSDGASHGTPVAGILGAVTNNDKGVAGVAGGWAGEGGIRIMHLRAGYWELYLEMDPAAAAQATDYAVAHGARVINMSFGGWTPHSALASSINNATSNGVLVVASAGNYRTFDPQTIQYPAKYSNTVAVGATISTDERKHLNDWTGETWGSCYGPELNVMAPGINVRTTDITGGAGYSTGEYFDRFSGTSASAPHVSGLAALILSINPSLTWQQVRDILCNTADKTQWMNGNNFTNEYGYGRVNAYRALLSASVPNPQTPSTPQNLAYTLVPVQTTYRPKFTWSKNAEAGMYAYVVHRYNNEFNYWEEMATVFQPETTFTDMLLIISRKEIENEWLATYKVQAMNCMAVYSDFSDPVSVAYKIFMKRVSDDDSRSITEFPSTIELGQNFPNPFNPETEISFALSEPSSVKIVVSDMLGREIVTLVDREYSAGYQKVTWKGTDGSGNRVGSGVYFYRIIATGQSGKQFTKVMKMALTK